DPPPLFSLTMSLDNSTVLDSDSYTAQVNRIALDFIGTYPYAARNAMVQLSLLFLSFGMQTVQLRITLIECSRRGSLSHTRVRILLLSTVLLYVSTGVYMAALIWNASTWNHVVVRATDSFFSPSYDGPEEIAEFQGAVRTQSWMLTVSTVINFIIGDAIVWWRACGIWRNNVVYGMGPSLVALTLSITPTTTLGLLLGENAYTYVSVMLSLITNVTATSLIAYKAWCHRQLVKTYLNAAGLKSRVLKALGLLVESGVAYCTFLVIMICFASVLASSLTDGAQVLVIVYGADPAASPSNPARAIFPTVVVVLVALKRSPIDNGGMSGAVQLDGANQLQDGPGSTSSTVVFHHSTFLNSAGLDTEACMGGMPVS
ncbi:hypothetical protein LXA43DRAFT_907514, partial [Ganoderma leucocontextum]